MESPRTGDRFDVILFRFTATQAGGLDGVAHEHGDGHGTNAAWNRSERARDIDGVGIYVTNQR